MKKSKPLCVEVFRGSLIESRHLIDASVCDAEGRVVLSYGNFEETIFPRSALKPFQTIPLIKNLIEQEIPTYLESEEISIITGSHNGERKHIETVRKLLQKYEIDERFLCCGYHWSLNNSIAEKQIIEIKNPSNIISNCSGKHAGMLILAKLLGSPLDGYLNKTHVVQQRVLGTCELFLGKSIPIECISVDGCGAPTFAGPIGNWARAYALLSNTKHVPDGISTAIKVLLKSVSQSPFHIAGSNRLCTILNGEFKEDIFGKSGAEGCYGCSLKEMGLGVFLKCRDGSKRGAEVALGHILKELGYNFSDNLDPFFYPVVKTFNDTEVGAIKIKNT